MKYFVLIYDQATGKVDIEEFPMSAAAAALARRFELEDEFQSQPSVEVVLLGAPSREALFRTHGRYFSTPQELAAAR